MDEVVKTLTEKRLFVSNIFYCMEKSKFSGEKDLEKLSDKSQFEGAWLFEEGQNLWYNITSNSETSFEEGLPTWCGLEIVAFEAETASTQYHIHLKSLLDSKLIRFNQEYGSFEKKFENPNNAKNNISSLTSILPSNEDMSYYARIVRKNPGQIDFGIISPLGRTIVEFKDSSAPKGLEYAYSNLIRKENLVHLGANTGRKPDEAIHYALGSINKSLENICTIKFEGRKE